MPGVTQEQCAGMIDHPLLNWQAPTAYNPVHAAMSNGLKQTLVSALEQTSSTSQK
jgi:hypothetical protein